MKELNIELPFANFDRNVICQLIEKPSEKLERLKQAIAGGTYQANAKELANILIIKLIAASGALDNELNVMIWAWYPKIWEN